MKISEEKLIEHLMDFIRSCDCDELCRLAEEAFGGKICLAAEQSDNLDDANIYEIEPNDNYYGEFDD
jgi:hypothetical protein